MKAPLSNRLGQWFKDHIKLPRGVRIAACILPAVLAALYYALRGTRAAMDWISVYAAFPIRRFFGMLSSIYPIALMELLCTVAVFLFFYYIIKAILDSSRKRDKWKLLGKRALGLLVALCYVFSAWCWLWNSGYHATGFAEKSGIVSAGVSTEDLIKVTQMFADKANELSAVPGRDETGSLVLNRSEMFRDSRNIYNNISEQFPVLDETIYEPKPMYLYSWLMTITGYTGMYFALTGEAMVNIHQHPAFMPATVAHEHAHQLGVFAEDEANFAGILACVTSEDPLFEYSGYLTGLNYLLGALLAADADECIKIMSGLTDKVKLDRAQNAEFWANARKSDTGIAFLDDILSSLKRASNEVADAVYESYLKSQNQELGLQSYGACVDLLVEYFKS